MKFEFNDLQNKIIEMLNEYDKNNGVLTKELLVKFSKEIKETVNSNSIVKMSEKEFEISYYVMGKINVRANDLQDALRNFHDRCGFSNDDLYENLDHDFKVNFLEVKNG